MSIELNQIILPVRNALEDQLLAITPDHPVLPDPVRATSTGTAGLRWLWDAVDAHVITRSVFALLAVARYRRAGIACIGPGPWPSGNVTGMRRVPCTLIHTLPASSLVKGSARCLPRPAGSAWPSNSLHWPGHRGEPGGPSGGCATPPEEPGSCARDWSSDGTTGQPDSMAPTAPLMRCGTAAGRRLPA